MFECCISRQKQPVQVPDKAVNASDKINRSNIHTNDTISL